MFTLQLPTTTAFYITNNYFHNMDIKTVFFPNSLWYGSKRSTFSHDQTLMVIVQSLVGASEHLD